MSQKIQKSLTNCVDNLLPILDEVNSLQNVERTLHHIVEQLVKDLNCKTCAIVEINPTTEYLEIRNFHGLSWSFCKNFRKKIDSPIIHDLIWKSESIYIPDKKFASILADELQMEHEFVSCYAVQLMANYQPLGFLYIDSDEPDNFVGEQQLVAQFYARLISMSISKERLYIELRRLNHLDEESGAIRYDHYFPRLQEIFHQAKRLNENFSVLLLDIEKYTSILKLYGIDVVRQMLKELVMLISQNLRQYDGLCRFGADEFLITLPGTTLSSAVEAAKKIQTVVKDAEFTQKKLKIRFFTGVANFPDNCSGISGLLTAAKNALLEAKRENRTDVVISLNEKYD